MNWNFKNIEKILVVFFVTMVIISSISISATQSKLLKFKNLNFDANEDEHFTYKSLTGLAPKTISEKSVFKTAVDDKNELEAKGGSNIAPLGETMWGYNAYASGISNGPVYFDIDDPGDITLLSSPTSGDFMSGGTWTPDERWICCEYGSGVLWEIDPDDGTQTPIGGGGQAMNGLSYNPTNNRMFGVGGTDDLYEVDYETGITEFVGSGGTGQTMIALAFDADGNCYSWDVKFSGESYLYSVDIETGAATVIGDMGKTLCYAQGGDFLMNEDRLILTAYIYSPEYGGYLCEVDPETGALEIIGEFEGSAEIDASMFQNIICIEHHDIGIKSINFPEDSGYAVPEIPMQVAVKNYGWYYDITDVKMQVIKYEEGPIIFEEDFSGTFPPEGWTTDWWNQSYTNMAGGTSPEARCYNYDQYYGAYDYYDNYIQSPPVNCSGIEKINLFFRWASDVYYNNYCSVYLKIRKNSTSPWKDVTPWTNPIGGDMEQLLYEVSCYGFGESLGDELQFKFEYLGYYYYFNYWWLDDVTIKSFNVSEEYNETIKEVEIPAGFEVIVNFSSWTPTYWQNPNYENTWQDYQVKACTLLEDDDKPKNNCKQKIIKLYFPWMHDIEITSIDSPCEDGPGKTYPVKATIKNVGQYPECCIPINISIGESVVLDTILTEESWDTVPPAGWTDEHKNYASDYGWDKSNTSYSGGSSSEARLPYNYALPDKVFYSYAFNTSDYSACQLEFLSYINHYSGQGFYTLESGYSYDGETWYTIWSESPDENEQYNVSVEFEGGYNTTYIGFWLKGDPWYMECWYIDDVEIDAVALVEEYSDSMCQGPDLEPGEIRTFEFDDWTPEALLDEVTTTNDYLIEATIEMEGDKDPGNDLKSGKFTLDFWHDAAIEVASPVLGREPEAWLGFDDGTAVNALGTCGPFEYAIRLTEDELGDYAGDSIVTVKRFHGYTTDFQMSGVVRIYEQGTSTSPGDEITNQPFEIFANDWHDIELENPVPIDGGEDIWVSIEVDCHSGQYPAAMDASNNYPTKGDWISLGSSWHEVSIYGFYCDWLIRAGVETTTGPGSIKAYIQPGTQEIKGLATNLGTFPELDLTCYSEIYEYITNCYNGTLVYEDYITDIDLDTSLGGTELLNFDNYNFLEEGRYGLFLNIPDDNDDKPDNNEIAWGIGVDETKPVSTHSIDPYTPDGDNGWYISDVEITLDAYDPSIGCGFPGSGVKEIKYKIVGGTTQTINGDHGTFVLDTDKDNLPIEYWAIDNVGNEETHHTFTIDMDQTDPDIQLEYNIVGGNYIEGWDFVFTATAIDATSGMSHVEFFLNDLPQDTIYGPGPTFEWGFTYNGDLNIVVKTNGYDMAGNLASDEIHDPKNKDNSQQISKSTTGKQVMCRSLKKILYTLEL